jgi:hypothetical protein
VEEIVHYIPVGGYSATAGIARGSAIVGEPGVGKTCDVTAFRTPADGREVDSSSEVRTRHWMKVRRVPEGFELAAPEVDLACAEPSES